MPLARDALFIGGTWARPATDAVLEVVSPHSEEVVARVPEGSTADIDLAVAAARRAFHEGPWPRMSPQERIDVVQNLSGLYAAKLEEMATIISTEMGSPISFSSLAQAPAPWMQIEAFLGIAREFPWEERRAGVLSNGQLPFKLRDHALFVGYAPVREPRYACAAIVEHGGGGSAIAAPIVRDILLEAQRRDSAGPARDRRAGGAAAASG